MSTQNATSPSGSEHFLIRFFDPNIKAEDDRSRTLDDILGFTNSELEYHHDYVQILFPLPEGSPFNYMAPTITRAVYDAFRQRANLKLGMVSAFSRMLRFFGFKMSVAHHPLPHSDESPEASNEDVVIVQSDNFHKQSRHWLRRFNHNHLRITRIIRSLRVLGLTNYAKAFHGALQDDEISSIVSRESQMYWRRAAERPLHLAPSDDDEDDGVNWLQGLETTV